MGSRHICRPPQPATHGKLPLHKCYLEHCNCAALWKTPSIPRNHGDKAAIAARIT